MSAPPGRVDGKVVLITGGAGAQGAHEARHLVDEGAAVVVTDVDVAKGTALATALGDRCRFVEHDVRSEASWNVVTEAALAAFGQLDALVHNAGVFRPSPISATTVESYLDTVAINQLGSFLALKAGAAAIGSGGSIVLISSVAGLIGTPGAIAYTSTKFAVRGMAKVAALELAPLAIRVNSVHPGAVDTPMIAAVHERPGGVEQVVDAIPLGRLAEPSDISGLVLFLVSDESAYCTGAEFVVDGGMTAGQHRGARR